MATSRRPTRCSIATAPWSCPGMCAPTPISTRCWREECRRRRSRPAIFPEILQYVWWRLDRALDEPSIRILGSYWGDRRPEIGHDHLVDHHASPILHRGILEMLGEEMARAGIRGVLCYEVTDRNGADGRRAWD